MQPDSRLDSIKDAPQDKEHVDIQCLSGEAELLSGGNTSAFAHVIPKPTFVVKIQRSDYQTLCLSSLSFQSCNMDPIASKKSFGSRVLRKFEQRIENRAPTRPPTRLESYRTTLMNLDDYLPQPEEDRKIASKVQQLQNLIEAHATYLYYHNRPLDLTPEDVQSLLQKRLFSGDDEDSSRRLASNLLTPSHRATFIRIVLARALITAMDLQGNPATSLLPQEIVLFMIAFKNTPRSKDNDQG
jgi:hypothetical protein